MIQKEQHLGICFRLSFSQSTSEQLIIQDTLNVTLLTIMATTVAVRPDAGPSRQRGEDTWQPKRYLEPNHPDNEEVTEQAAYQAAVTRPQGDSRGNRKYKPRRTVDYMGGVQKWRMVGGVLSRRADK